MEIEGVRADAQRLGRLHCAFVLGLDQFARLAGPGFDFPEPLRNHLDDILEKKSRKAKGGLK